MNSELPWFQESFAHLTERAKNNTLPHALLLAGAKGIGKLTFARSLAKAFLNTEHSHHPDFFELMPEEDKKNISVDQVRTLIQKLSQTAHQSGYKVAIIYPAEAMNIAASNALLKTLEEPQGKTVLILVSHQRHRLLPTIISRCQRIHFKPPQPVVIPAEAGIQEDLNNVIEKKINPIKLAETWAKGDVETTINLMFVFVSDLIRNAMSDDIKTGSVSLSKNVRYTDVKEAEGRKPVSEKDKRALSTEHLFSTLSKITDAKRALQTQSNPNKQLLLENLLLELSWN